MSNLIISMIAFIMIGVALIRHVLTNPEMSPLVAIPITLFVLVPCLCLGSYVGFKFMR